MFQAMPTWPPPPLRASARVDDSAMAEPAIFPLQGSKMTVEQSSHAYD